MSNFQDTVQLALREKRGVIVPLAVWALITLICGITGPFGTHDVMGVAGRLGYWGLVVGMSVLGSSYLSKAADQPPLRSFLLWAGFALLLTLLIWGLNSMLFVGWQSAQLFLYLLVTVSLIVLVVHGTFLLLDYARPEVPTTTGDNINPQTRFLRRLPLADRGALIRIEAQDHYLKVVTDKGAPLILMRLGEAVEELGETSGLQVHRSHWVALDAVTAHHRIKGRDVLTLSDGAEIPVSRGNRRAAQEAGLF